MLGANAAALPSLAARLVGDGGDRSQTVEALDAALAALAARGYAFALPCG